MKINITHFCATCQKETGRPNFFDREVEFNESGKYEFECSLGHRSLTVLMQLKFEVLFEIATHAITDGYHREAVTSFALSMERFYEFAIRTLMFKASLSDSLFQATWKHVCKQSERQLGAFVFVWAQHFKSLPPLLSSKDAELRNKTVHNGYLPDKSEAIQFGEKVLHIARSAIDTLIETCQQERDQVRMLYAREGLGRDVERQDRTSFSRGPLLSVSSIVHKDYRKSLTDEIGSLESERALKERIKLHEEITKAIQTTNSQKESPDL